MKQSSAVCVLLGIGFSRCRMMRSRPIQYAGCNVTAKRSTSSTLNEKVLSWRCRSRASRHTWRHALMMDNSSHLVDGSGGIDTMECGSLRLKAKPPSDTVLMAGNSRPPKRYSYIICRTSSGSPRRVGVLVEVRSTCDGLGWRCLFDTRGAGRPFAAARRAERRRDAGLIRDDECR